MPDPFSGKDVRTCVVVYRTGSGRVARKTCWLKQVPTVCRLLREQGMEPVKWRKPNEKTWRDCP